MCPPMTVALFLIKLVGSLAILTLCLSFSLFIILSTNTTTITPPTPNPHRVTPTPTAMALRVVRAPRVRRVAALRVEKVEDTAAIPTALTVNAKFLEITATATTSAAQKRAIS